MTRLALATLAAALALGPGRAADPGEEAARSYRLDTSGTTRSLKVGERGKLVVAIDLLKPEVHIDPKTPLKVRLEAPAGLKLEKAELGHKDAVDPKAEGRRFEVAFTATAAGRHEARANLDFFVCTDTWCVKQVRQLALAVEAR